jgi:hypothetical protein
VGKNMQEESDYKILEKFVVSNSDLEELEIKLEKFNIFEAIDVVRQEIRHTKFLAFLLDPSKNGGLGDTFVKRVLQKAIANSANLELPITPIDLDSWDLHDVIVHPEWQNIDILILEETIKLAIIIENKIDGTESEGQLKRYQETVKKQFPDYNIVCLYLTPEGDIPSNEEYIPISYGLVCEVVETLIKTKESILGPDLLILIRNYAEMLRRHIVGESEIAKLCQKIYRKHQKALDLIFEYKPDLQVGIRQYLEDLIDKNPDLIKDHCSKSYIRFLPKDWDVPNLKKGQGWVSSNRILLFEFYNGPEKVALRLYIGPGEQQIREKLYDMAASNKKVFKASGSLRPKWKSIYTRNFATENELQDNEYEAIVENIEKHWQKFLGEDLYSINAVIKGEKWIWE